MPVLVTKLMMETPGQAATGAGAATPSAGAALATRRSTGPTAAPPTAAVHVRAPSSPPPAAAAGWLTLRGCLLWIEAGFEMGKARCVLCAAALADRRRRRVRVRPAMSMQSSTRAARSTSPLPACAAAFPSCARSILTEIYLCHACSCHETLSGNAAAGGLRARRHLQHAVRRMQLRGGLARARVREERQLAHPVSPSPPPPPPPASGNVGVVEINGIGKIERCRK
jgi:hypothetical protein